MTHITVLLIDGHGEGQKFALPDDLHTVEVFSADNQTKFSYQIHRFILGDQTYMIGALDPRKIDDDEVAKKIHAAKLDPLPEA
jgi:hypothetical protein